MKKFLLFLVPMLTIFASGFCYAPVYPENVNGTTLNVAGPLFISDYEPAYNLFKNVPALLRASIGFLHVALVRPSVFSFIQNPSIDQKLELFSFKQGLLRLNFVDSLGEGLTTNKRVILYCRGVGRNKKVRFDIRGKTLEFDAGEFGILLGRLFQTRHIEVSQVDLLTGFGETIGKGVFQGLKATGMKDFTVRCFKGMYVSAPTGDSIEPIEIVGLGENRDVTANIDTETFLRTGEVVGDAPHQEGLFAIFTEGNPAPITPPPPPPACDL